LAWPNREAHTKIITEKAYRNAVECS